MDTWTSSPVDSEHMDFAMTSRSNEKYARLRLQTFLLAIENIRDSSCKFFVLLAQYRTVDNIGDITDDDSTDDSLLYELVKILQDLQRRRSVVVFISPQFYLSRCDKRSAAR